MDAEDAGAFTGGGADSSGEFREVIGFVESVEGFPPESAIYEVVPLGDEIVDRAAAGHAADEGARPSTSRRYSIKPVGFPILFIMHRVGYSPPSSYKDIFLADNSACF